MKKWLILASVVLLLLLAAVYVFIPANLTVSKSVGLRCNISSGARFLEDEQKWIKWWPSGRTGDGSAAGRGDGPGGAVAGTGGKADGTGGWAGGSGFRYKPGYKSYHNLDVHIDDGDPGDSGFVSRIALAPLNGRDSMLVHWECSLAAGATPVSRIAAYRKGLKIKKDMDGVFASLRTFLEKDENVYGVAIRETSSNDTIVMATRVVFPNYPGTSEIYGILKKINAYIVQQGGKQTAYPIMNIMKSPDGGYKALVAIPVEKSLPNTKDIFSQHIVPWKFLSGEVRGGVGNIIAAEDQMQNYINDYHRTAMAIHYQSLVTDRSREPDSSKWVTRLYYPIF